MEEKRTSWDRWTAAVSPELKDEIKAAMDVSGQTGNDFLVSALAAWRESQEKLDDGVGRPPEIRQVRGQFAKSMALVEAVITRAANQEALARDEVKDLRLSHAQERDRLTTENRGLQEQITALEAENTRLREVQESREMLKAAYDTEKQAQEVRITQQGEALAKLEQEIGRLGQSEKQAQEALKKAQEDMAREKSVQSDREKNIVEQEAQKALNLADAVRKEERTRAREDVQQALDQADKATQARIDDLKAQLSQAQELIKSLSMQDRDGMGDVSPSRTDSDHRQKPLSGKAKKK